MWRWVSVLGLLALTADGASAQEVSQPDELVGCYVLDLGEWQPPLAKGNKAFQTPPDTLRLSDEVGDGSGSPFERGRKLIRPVIDQGRTPSAYWTQESSGTVQIVWTSGHAGVRLTLRETGDDRLAGVAEAFTDVLGRPLPRAEVTLRRFECTGY